MFYGTQCANTFFQTNVAPSKILCSCKKPGCILLVSAPKLDSFRLRYYRHETIIPLWGKLKAVIAQGYYAPECFLATKTMIRSLMFYMDNYEMSAECKGQIELVSKFIEQELDKLDISNQK